MRACTDMMGRTVMVPEHPKRIVSLVPSQTELLYALGLTEEVAGITKFCIHPEEWFRSKTRVGGTKKLHIDRIRALHPDLIIANKEENTQAEIELLAADYPVWISDVRTVAQGLAMIRAVGAMVNRPDQAGKIVDTIQNGFAALPPSDKPVRTAYFIWRNPWMTVGADTFIHDMMAHAGLHNVYADQHRYPETDLSELQERRPHLVLLSSEPYPFKERHIAEIRSALPEAAILLADGELFSWYGSRMQYAPAYFQELKSLLL